MIVTFSITNFRSFSDEATLSLVASNRISPGDDSHTVSILGTEKKVLRVGVIYGANGAGKSNFFKALNYVKMMTLQARKRNQGTDREAFCFQFDPLKPSTFDIQFIAREQLYRYGLVVDDQRVLEEWLVEINGNRENIIYERITDTQGNVTIELKGLEGKDKKLTALATIGGPQNQTFLATIRATLETSDYSKTIALVLSWFEEGLSLVSPDSKFLPLGHYLNQNMEFKAFAGEFLKSTSTGVDKLEVFKEEITEEKLGAILPKHIFSDVVAKTSEEGKAVVQVGEDSEVLIERSDKHHYYSLTIRAIHEHESDRVVHLNLSEESDGTRRLLNLVPALHQFQKEGGVYVIDEIDRSMHPILVQKFMEFFLKSCEGARRQLIVTTHESTLLDQKLFRRDEIWFAEKDHHGATKLHSLADFKVRNDLQIRKHYIQGRFGAVPFLGDMDRFIEKKISVK